MISIIIATYNRKNILPKSLASIFNQTYQDFEVIIVDDGSTDNTEQLFQGDFKNSKIRYIKLPENKGATFARNKGLEEVRGEYFMVWDSDDILYPNALETVFKIYGDNKNLAVVSAPARSLLNGAEIEYPNLPAGMTSKEIIICRSLPANHKVRIARTDLCGDIRYKVKNIDFLVNVEMVERGGWYCHAGYLADVILESDTNSLTVQRKKTNLHLSALRAPYLADYLLKYKETLLRRCPENYAGFSYGTSIGFFVSGDIEKTREFISASLRIKKNLKYLLLYVLTFLPLGIQLLKFTVSVKNRLV